MKPFIFIFTHIFTYVTLANPLLVSTRFDSSIDNNVNILYIYIQEVTEMYFSFMFVCVAMSL